MTDLVFLIISQKTNFILGHDMQSESITAPLQKMERQKNCECFSSGTPFTLAYYGAAPAEVCGSCISTHSYKETVILYYSKTTFSKWLQVSHVHIRPPADMFPFSRSATYRPSPFLSAGKKLFQDWTEIPQPHHVSEQQTCITALKSLNTWIKIWPLITDQRKPSTPKASP